jgi:hypothetical protein
MQVHAGGQQARVPAAAFTSASVRPPASAWLIKVCRPWWMVSDRRRSQPSTRQAVRNRSSRTWRLSASPKVARWSEQTKGSLPLAPCLRRYAIHRLGADGEERAAAQQLTPAVCRKARIRGHEQLRQEGKRRRPPILSRWNRTRVRRHG